MTKIAVSRLIDASPETVFEAVANIEALPENDPDIIGIEFLTAKRSGVGTRFRETRRMKDKEHVTELEVTEFETNRRARMVADSHGTVWDTVFSVRRTGDRTELEIAMDARPHRLLPRLMNPLMKGFFRKGLEKHIDSVRERCENKP